MKNILIAEDDKNIIKLISLYLKAEKFDLFIATNGIEALELLKNNKIDLALIDIMMPEMDGYELTQEIRQFSNIPIIIMSAKSEDNDKIIGLNLGADDYITKPFNPLELIARIKAKFRRLENTSKSIIKIKNIVLNCDTCNLQKDGEDVSITATEFKILSLLMKNPNRIYSKEQIFNYIYSDFCDQADENTITVHISRLRNKMGVDENGNNYIKTIIGLGYKIENI